MVFRCPALLVLAVLSAGPNCRDACAQVATQRVTRASSADFTPPPPPELSPRSPRPPKVISPAASPIPGPNPQRNVAPPAPTPPAQLPGTVLAWDSDLQEVTLQPGQFEAHFLFNFTNVSPVEVTIHSVGTSCGCTTAKLPAMPWKIGAGATGQIPVTMNVAGKNGVVFKSVTINTDKGVKTLMVKTTILSAPAPAANAPNSS